MSKLTSEEKAHFAPMLRRTFEAIAYDVQMSDGWTGSQEEIIEITCDANRPQIFGGMSREEENRLYECYNDPDTQQWLRDVLNY